MATHTLRLTDEQLNVINAGLQEVALKHAAPVIAAINHQLALERQNYGSTGLQMGMINQAFDAAPEADKDARTVLDKAEAYLPDAAE